MKNSTSKQIVLIVFTAFALFSCGTPGESNETTTDNHSADNHSTAVDNSHSKGQADAMDDVSTKNILQIAIGSKDHTTLVAGVQAAGIEHVIVNAGPLTVFAPTNDAFAALPEGVLDNLLKPENKADLANILTMHAAPGTYNLKQLRKEAKKGRKIYTATGDYFEVKVEGDDIFVGGAKVLGEVDASNGVVVVVDAILSNK